jgi:late competence protein required for DNA uptake (superfamily II DNA/RNA helicase)
LEKPLFDYEQILYDALLVHDTLNHNHSFKHKHLWVKKATGLGVTEFFLRLMAWLCLRNNDYQNSQMCIVTGPNIDIAIKLIKRMKALFEPKLHVTFDSKETLLYPVFFFAPILVLVFLSLPYRHHNDCM